MDFDSIILPAHANPIVIQWLKDGKLKIMPSGCWEWQLCRNRAGYGIAGIKQQDGNSKQFRAHRVAANYPMPCALHSCDNPPCCNPGHIRAGTKHDNSLDMQSRRRSVKVGKMPRCSCGLSVAQGSIDCVHCRSIRLNRPLCHCGDLHYAKGLCNRHYEQLRKKEKIMTQLLTLDNMTYRRLPGLSGSELKHLAISPAHLWAARKAPRTESDAMRIGTLIHSMALEGLDVFTSTYTEAVQCPAEFKSGPRKGQLCGKFGCGTHGDGVSGNEYTPEELAQICHVSEAIRSHPHAKKLLAVGKPEVCIVGNNRKGRLDWLHPNYIVDLKTTGKNVNEWEPGIGELLQAGAYLNLAEDCPDIGPRCWAWIIAEQNAPYAVRVIVLSPDDQASAQAAARRLQATYDDCLTAENWPSLEVPENPEFAEIKPWLKTQLQVIR